MALADEHAAYQSQLLESGLLLHMGRDGLYGRSQAFENIVNGLVRLIGATFEDVNATNVSFPPVFPRESFEPTDYIASFPNLTGAIYTFLGDNKAHATLMADRSSGQDWMHHLEPAGTFLTSAVCHPLYATMQGQRLDGERRYSLVGHCFRNEPSKDPMRLTAFRMFEIVFVGTPEEVTAGRMRLIDGATDLLLDLGLKVRPAAANDPFFGRAGRILAANQREQNLKTELVVDMYEGSEDGTAIASGNYHLDHFGTPYSITSAAGDVAHSACFGFGLERIALALLRAHGLDLGAWPEDVRSALGL